jgi:hypothetical protein
VVTSKVPLVIVKILAIPNTDPDDNCNDVPLITVLKRLAVPLKVDVPVKVTVPADADKLPLTVMLDDMEKLALLVIDPVIYSCPNPIVPAPDMVFEVPLMVMVLVPAVKLPLTERLLLIFKEIKVVTIPLIVRFPNEMPVPLIVVPEPLITSVPPEAWINEPDPLVARLPVNVMLLEEKVMPEAATVRLLKF